MFIKLQQDSSVADRVKNHKIGKQGKAVLGAAFFIVDKNNLLKGSPATLQEVLGLGKSDFELGMQQLKEANIVRKYSKREYMFNPDLISYGDERSYYILKNKWDTQTSVGLRK